MQDMPKTQHTRHPPLHTERTPSAIPKGKFRVVVPDAVVLPLPKTPRDEIRVPASIDGRDLSTGRF